MADQVDMLARASLNILRRKQYDNTLSDEQADQLFRLFLTPGVASSEEHENARRVNALYKRFPPVPLPDGNLDLGPFVRAVATEMMDCDPDELVAGINHTLATGTRPPRRPRRLH